MTKRFDETISSWLEESAPAGLVLVAGLVAGLYANRPGLGGNPSPGGGTPTASAAASPSPSLMPTAAATSVQASPSPSAMPTPTPTPTPTLDARQPFIGVWVSTSDGDGGTQTMTVTDRTQDRTVDVVVLDTVASVCGGTSSTMAGTAAVDGPNLVIPAPDYSCDDGSEPHLINGDPTPLNEVLRNLTYVLNSELGILTVGDEVWSRQPTDLASPTPLPSDVFVGIWEATDNPPDSSHLTLEVVAKANGKYTVVIHDDSAAVCQGTASTMTGVAAETEPGTVVIAQPDYRCDDGSQAHELSGPPLLVQLRNYSFTYVAATDQLREPGGVEWSRSPLDD